MGTPHKRCRVHCLIDTGSQRSYISSSVINYLKLKPTNYQSLNIKTFIGTSSRSMYEQSLIIFDQQNHDKSLSFLVETNLSLNVHIDGLYQVIQNFSRNNIKLANDLLPKNSISDIQCLLGVDGIQYLPPMTMVKCLNGVAFSTPEGMIPFGEVNNFLPPPK